MPDRDEVDVWLVQLDTDSKWLPPTPAEAERANRLISAPLQQRYLRSHAALRAILAEYTSEPLDFVVGKHGKPYLARVPHLNFNLSHSHEMAIVGVGWGFEVGVDVEWLRPMPASKSIAERFFPPGEAAAFAEIPAENREPQFFHMWTRIEAKLKARGVGLYGAGAELDGEWTVLPIDADPAYAAAMAACRSGVTMQVRHFAG